MLGKINKNALISSYGCHDEVVLVSATTFIMLLLVTIVSFIVSAVPFIIVSIILELMVLLIFIDGVRGVDFFSHGAILFTNIFEFLFEDKKFIKKRIKELREYILSKDDIVSQIKINGINEVVRKKLNEVFVRLMDLNTLMNEKMRLELSLAIGEYRKNINRKNTNEDDTKYMEEFLQYLNKTQEDIDMICGIDNKDKFDIEKTVETQYVRRNLGVKKRVRMKK